MTRPNNPKRKRMAPHQQKPESSGPLNRRFLYAGAAALALAVLSVLVYGWVAPKPVATRSPSTDPAPTPAELNVGAPAPDMTFTTIDGTQRKLSEFHGQKVMLWFFATWCTSCQAGAQALAKNFDQLRAAGVQIIQLKLYNNLGYPGPSVAEFAQKFIGPAANSSSWLLGDASEAGSYRYDARGYPDIYFLLSKDSTIQAINGVPDTTMEQILTFAHQSQ